MNLLKFLRPTKALLFCTFFCYSFFALTAAASAQSSPDTAFYQLEDLTGYGPIPAHLADSLNVAALSLRDALPEEFQSSFGVYDLGFYHHHSSLVGGIPDVITNAIANRITHSYYLVFGRELDNEGILKKVWVEMELPNTSQFCYWEDGTFSHMKFMVELKANVPRGFSASDKFPIFMAVKDAIQYMGSRVDQLVDCCSSAARQSCECGWSFDGIRDFTSINGFYEFEVEVLPVESINTECICWNESQPDETSTPETPEDSLEIYSYTTITELSFGSGILLSLTDLKEMFYQLGNLYKSDGQTFFAAITDQHFFCGANEDPPTSLRSASQKYNVDDIFTQIHEHDIGIWYNILSNEGEATVSIYSKGIDSKGVGWASKFSGEFGVDTENINFLGFSINIKKENPLIYFDRMSDLYRLVDNNPDGLISDCFEGSGFDTQFWSYLANFTPNQQVIDKIKNLPGSFSIQDIESAWGRRLNMDYFGVNVHELPNKPDGTKFNEDELLSHFRKNITEFQTEDVEFLPYKIDEELWFSDNPLTALITIRMIDDGTVICSDYTNCCWVFTTIKAPGWIASFISGTEWFTSDGDWFDGYHPVSGNRQFGWSNVGGQIKIFIKGVDRATAWYHAVAENKVFEGADDLWFSMETELAKFINQNGGSAEVFSTKRSFRPNWKVIRDLIRSPYPFNAVPCQ